MLVKEYLRRSQRSYKVIHFFNSSENWRHKIKWPNSRQKRMLPRKKKKNYDCFHPSGHCSRWRQCALDSNRGKSAQLLTSYGYMWVGAIVRISGSLHHNAGQLDWSFFHEGASSSARPCMTWQRLGHGERAKRVYPKAYRPFLLCRYRWRGWGSRQRESFRSMESWDRKENGWIATKPRRAAQLWVRLAQAIPQPDKGRSSPFLGMCVCIIFFLLEKLKEVMTYIRTAK